MRRCRSRCSLATALLLAFAPPPEPIPATDVAPPEPIVEPAPTYERQTVVFQEICEFRALAYSAWGMFARDYNPAQAGYFIGGIGCQADKTYEAIDVMMGLIRELPDKPERINALRSALVRRLESSSPGFRELQRTIPYWQRVGYTEDPRRSLLDGYARLEFADIEALHRPDRGTAGDLGGSRRSAAGRQGQARALGRGHRAPRAGRVRALRPYLAIQ